MSDLPYRRATFRQADRTDNKVSLYNSGQPLGVECVGCGRRALTFADPKAFARLQGDMTRLQALKFKCTKCGSREVQLWMFYSDEHREKFMERPVGGPEF